jgi:hypothetical protein
VGGFIDVAAELLKLADRCMDVFPSTSNILTVRSTINQITTSCIPVLKLADSVLLHVEDKNYPMAIYACNTLYQKISALYRAKLVADSLDADNRIKIAVNSTEKQIAEADLKKAKAELGQLNDIDFGVLRYGLFIATVATAKSSADVKAAINAFSLPVGSSRIKKERSLTVGLNAYVGVYHSWNKSYPGLNLPAQEWGLTAPLGIGINKGISSFKFLGAKIPQFGVGLYGGIFDVGAIFTYKTQNDALKSDIQLSQIFSPSATFLVNFPIIKRYNIPLAFGASLQWGPQLRKVDETGNSIFPLLTRRFTLFLAFDLPIVNFYTSQKQTQ